MLHEVFEVSQLEGEPPRRWFADAYFDLIVWEEESGGVRAFHLSYDKAGRERVVEWRKDQGVSHFVVDRADSRPARHARTPFLVPAKPEDLGKVLALFEAASADLEPQIAAVVRKQLRLAVESTAS